MKMLLNIIIKINAFIPKQGTKRIIEPRRRAQSVILYAINENCLPSPFRIAQDSESANISGRRGERTLRKGTVSVLP